MTLYSFFLSHYTEKVRWVLDYQRIPYRERYLPPGLHRLFLKFRVPGTTLPVLYDGRWIQGSSAILDHVDRGDLPGSAELEARLDEEVGLPVLRQIYRSSPVSECRSMWLRRLGPVGRTWILLAAPLVRYILRSTYDLHRAEESLGVLRRFLDDSDRWLSERPFLLGDRLGRCDLVLGALLAPMVRPPQHPFPFPARPSWAAVGDEVRQRRTGQWVLQLYRDYR